MTLIYQDGINETTTVTGTSEALLLGAIPGAAAFSSVMSNNQQCFYIIQTPGTPGSPQYQEVGLGSYDSSGNGINRNTVLWSTNNNQLVSFPAGTKSIFMTNVSFGPHNFTTVGGPTVNISPATSALLTLMSQVPQALSFQYALNASYTALAGGGKTGATPLLANYNILGTVATAGDSVLLPPAVATAVVIVSNQGAQPCQAFGSGTDTINSVANGTGMFIGAGATVTLVCSSTGNWQVAQASLFGPVAAPLTTNGAISPHASQNYVITKAGVFAGTLAAPTSGTDDTNVLQFISNTANAHTVTAGSALYNTGGAGAPYTIATFAAKLGAGFAVQCYKGTYNLLWANGVTFS